MKKNKRFRLLGDIIGMAAAFLIFVVPFIFILSNSLKDRREANLLQLALPETFVWKNYSEVFTANNYILLTAFKNSILLTVFSVGGLIIVCSMAGYILQRRKDGLTKAANFVTMMGLMVPPAILPTIWITQGLHIDGTMFSMVMIEIALQIPFDIMLYRGFVGTIPIELEEAGYIDGCERLGMFCKIIFPLLKPVTATVIILNAVSVFNDFTNPLYFFPGRKNATVQLTLYNFMGQYQSSYNLLFADVIIITIPMLILFIIFNKRIVDGMVAGSVKG
ncbi:carbohydrate ABC transporter permease [Murimonas intestini]|mgnify:CR=1 FL=1|uniref:Raffinose/stachyose/melibiose transport system permease protein n=1 Tax=Murimonas intestini TaxID=1337051 RepID=A0AB73T391_9FIRM|nr:carbohydrate ABC transporter permease [Murimonas intestini]MCR1841582.1 carbohydrate ABC transporter permease [Murimonas intestini]MCR1867087.1 carbohydrate ABC transporter permease [Murimonas intestini]MCR1884110.1 carbohydrate ABC transporter permease [Murimonas intestini]